LSGGSVMSRQNGLVTQVTADWIEIKVPIGKSCGMCSSMSTCTFRGPDSAYQRYRVSRGDVTGIVKEGDRVTLENPEKLRYLAAGVLLVLPVVLILTGVGLVECCIQVPYGPIWIALLGISIYITALIVTERKVRHAAKLQPRIIPSSIP
jgi:positive regulator of sigma E activity